MQLKYVRFDATLESGEVKPVVIAFSTDLIHQDVANRLKYLIAGELNTPHVTIPTAGFIVFPDAIINGRSDSIGVESSQDDLKLFTV